MIAGLVMFLVVYGFYGLVVAANVWRLADRHASFYQHHRWLAFGQWGATNPLAWRAYGSIATAFSVVVLGWLALTSVTRLPPMARPVGALILAAAAVAGLVGYLWVRHRRRS